MKLFIIIITALSFSTTFSQSIITDGDSGSPILVSKPDKLDTFRRLKRAMGVITKSNKTATVGLLDFSSVNEDAINKVSTAIVQIKKNLFFAMLPEYQTHEIDDIIDSSKGQTVKLYQHDSESIFSEYKVKGVYRKQGLILILEKV